MNDEILKKLEEQDVKIEKIFVSVEKTRQYILWAVILTIVAAVLPLIGLLFAIPSFLGQYSSMMGI